MRPIPFLTLLLCCAAPVRAHEPPRVPAVAHVEAIVFMAEQAPVAELDAALTRAGASRRERHREVLRALHAATASQSDLRAWLDGEIARGAATGYTPYWIANLIVVSASPASLAAIAGRGDVAAVEPNFAPSIPRAAPPSAGTARGRGVTPGLAACRVPEVWDGLGITGEGALIGCLDTGVDGGHPALAGRWRGVHAPAAECWLDLLGGGTSFPADPLGHGTHVTGTMLGQEAADSIGVAPGAEWIACNAIAQGAGPAFDNAVFAALQWFADPDGDPDTVADVPDVLMNAWGVNENLGYPGCDARWWAAIDHCEAAGVVTLWAAGGDGPGAGTVRSPADRASSAHSSFAVGAVDASAGQSFPYTVASFSSRGPTDCDVEPELAFKPELVAPGVNVLSSVPGGYAVWSGSAMAGPHVAGVVALMRSANPELTVEQVKRILLLTARDQDAPGDDNDSGLGMVDAYAAVGAALDLVGLPGEAEPAGATRLLASRPNPFRPGDGPVALRYILAAAGPARVQVFDVGGRLLRTLADGRQDAGEHVLRWDGRDARGHALSSGVYFVRLGSGGQGRSGSLVLIR